jgi:hypothetical protein
MTPDQEKKLNETHSTVMKIDAAMNGDDYGNKGYKQRLEAVEDHVEQAKGKRQRERGFMTGIALLWGGIVWLLSKVFHI